MDDGIKRYVRGQAKQKEVEAEWVRLGEVAFDFDRRRLTVILQQSSDPTADSLLICKGACEEVLLKCQHMQKGDGIIPLCKQSMTDLMAKCEDMSSEGLRVLALATRLLPSSQREFSGEDESDMLFRGFLIFLDPPKASAMPAIARLHDLGIQIKVLTGDNLLVAKRVCKELAIPSSVCVMGSQLAMLEDDDFITVVEQASIFAKVTPQQKMMIVSTLQKQNHICGFMGDGTNDGLALRKADVGICVDSGTDVAKDASDMIMLDKDLEKIAQGVAIGRITYGNTVKYIKFAASSSFGNTFSILAGAAWLPFNPLAPIQVLALNLLYNISQMAIPWDTMDPMFVKLPKRWSAKSLAWYMLCIGPTSSIFDITTFLIAWYFFKANNASDAAIATFTTIWFLESLMTQTFIVHLLRTERIPFIQSRAAWPLMVSSFGTMGLGFAVCYLPKVNHALALAAPPPLYYVFLVATVAVYCFTVQVFKLFYIRVFRSWL
jgi:Mg2+-importing ATPase